MVFLLHLKKGGLQCRIAHTGILYSIHRCRNSFPYFLGLQQASSAPQVKALFADHADVYRLRLSAHDGIRLGARSSFQTSMAGTRTGPRRVNAARCPMRLKRAREQSNGERVRCKARHTQLGANHQLDTADGHPDFGFGSDNRRRDIPSTMTIWKCEDCAQDFPSRSTWRRHAQDAGHRSFPCPHPACSEIFLTEAGAALVRDAAAPYNLAT